MSHKRRKTKTEHPSGRPEPSQQQRPWTQLGRTAATPRLPRLPGHRMR